MKCEHCGNKEVTFVFRSNINGKVTEKHLCSECAEKLGYTKKLRAGTGRMLDNFMRDPFFEQSRLLGGSLFGRDFMDGFFREMDLLPGGIENPLDDLFEEMPALQAEPEKKTECAPAKEEPVKTSLDSRFARMRKLNALKAEQRKAIRTENFERAAELRDEIRKFESENA